MFWMGHGAWGPHMWGIGGLGLLLGLGLLKLLLLAGVIALIVALFRRRGHQERAQRPAPHSSALDILDARLARGEVTVEEYKEMKRTLLA